MDSYTFPSLSTTSSSSSKADLNSTPMDQSTSLRIPRSRSNSTSATNRPCLPSRSSSSSAFDDSKRRKRSSTLFSSESMLSSLPSSSTIRSSQHSHSTFDPLDSRIVYASMSNLRGQSTPAVVVALPKSTPKSLVFPGRKSSLGPARTPTVIPTRRTSLPPSPYFQPSNTQATAESSIQKAEVYTAPMASSSSMKKLPRSSSSRRSLSSLIGSMFSSSASSTGLVSAARNPEGFTSDSWEHAVAVGVIEAGQARPGRDAPSIFGRKVSRRNKALPALRVEEEVDPSAREVRGSITESYYHPSAGYFEQEGDETETEATHRRPFSTKTSETWELDVDLGGQGLGIAHLFDEDTLQTTYDVFSPSLPLPSSLTTIDEDRTPARQRNQTHSSTDSSSTAFSSLPPVTPRLRSSSPTIALPRPKATFFPAPIDIDLLPPHLPDLPPTSPLDVTLFPIATPPKDALLDLSPRRRSLRPPGIAAPVAMHQDQDLPVEIGGQMPFVKAEQFFSLGDGQDGNERQRKLRARVSSCGTFGGKRRSMGSATCGTKVDLGSESELEELISDDGSSMYSQESTKQPLNVKPRPVSVPVSIKTETTATNESVFNSSSPHAPSFMTLGPAVSRGSASSLGSSSPPPSPSRPPRNPARDAIALASQPNLW